MDSEGLSIEERGGVEFAADCISEPYPDTTFLPFSADEERLVLRALRDCGVKDASERLHAAWARHWANWLRKAAA